MRMRMMILLIGRVVNGLKGRKKEIEEEFKAES